MDPKLEKLKNLLAEVYDLNQASAVLDWDFQTYMPAEGAEGRGNQLATLARIAHLKFTSDEIGQLIHDLESDGLDPDQDDARLVERVKQEYEKQVRVPPEWVTEFNLVTSRAMAAWQTARQESSFAAFQPHLEKIVALRRDYARLYAPYDHIYDPLLDDFEPGLKTADVQAIFNTLRTEQVALVQAIAQKPPIDDAFIYQPYDEQAQWDFGVEVITDFGFDWQRGRQDRSAHPFTTSFGLDDVRITTRYEKDNGLSALFSTMHECGHALYELGFERSFFRTPLARSASLAMHESQSRMWENLVGRSLPFWSHYYPRLQERFPAYLGGLSLQDFYRGINRVNPSLIRVEADEATYNLHIMLRLDLEIALLEGNLAVSDLPAAWNALMKEYLGVTPPNDALGVLQDVHWSGGMLGYFPTYALGNLVSVQLWERIHGDLPNLDEQIARGKFDELLAWLRAHIHNQGARYEPQELIQRTTGSKIDPQPYLRYLTAKYGQIYNL